MDKIDLNQIPSTLNVTLYGKLEDITDTLSKCRVRIFYKGMNRNRTFISDDFANQLINSLPYTPVKGIFNKEDVDFEDHGEDNTDGRIYGIVMAEPNFAWEEHEDEDGVIRSYACADVLLFTGLYPEAKLVIGESQSMEIFRGTLKGEWRINDEDKKPYYHFLNGSLLGLQILGKEVEPCFEGAAFFSLYKDIKEMANYIKILSDKKEEKVKMDKDLFRISDSEKFDILFSLINPNYNEEGGWELNGFITDIYDDYFLYVKRGGEHVRVYYTKENDNIALGDSVEIKIVDVTESEYNALEAMKAIGGNYENIKATYEDISSKVEVLESEKAEFEIERNSLNEQLTELQNEFENSKAKITSMENSISEFENKEKILAEEKVGLENQLSDITNEYEKLVSFKNQIETEKKEAILTKYEEHLSDSAFSELKNSIDKYSIEDFKKEVCTAAVEQDPTIFNRDKEPEIFYKGKTEEKDGSGIFRILNAYKNGGNK